MFLDCRRAVGSGAEVKKQKYPKNIGKTKKVLANIKNSVIILFVAAYAVHKSRWNSSVGRALHS